MTFLHFLPNISTEPLALPDGPARVSRPQVKISVWKVLMNLNIWYMGQLCTLAIHQFDKCDSAENKAI